MRLAAFPNTHNGYEKADSDTNRLDSQKKVKICTGDTNLYMMQSAITLASGIIFAPLR